MCTRATRWLRERTDRSLGIILKIETRRGFQNLPRLLLEALRSRPVGVMIARGDLAVECGYERLAEVQEEMLNKGPHTVEAVRTLDNILRRMQMHQRKKRTLFRRLAVSFAAVEDAPHARRLVS